MNTAPAVQRAEGCPVQACFAATLPKTQHALPEHELASATHLAAHGLAVLLVTSRLHKGCPGHSRSSSRARQLTLENQAPRRT